MWSQGNLRDLRPFGQQNRHYSTARQIHPGNKMLIRMEEKPLPGLQYLPHLPMNIASSKQFNNPKVNVQVKGTATGAIYEQCSLFVNTFNGYPNNCRKEMKTDAIENNMCSQEIPIINFHNADDAQVNNTNVAQGSKSDCSTSGIESSIADPSEGACSTCATQLPNSNPSDGEFSMDTTSSPMLQNSDVAEASSEIPVSPKKVLDFCTTSISIDPVNGTFRTSISDDSDDNVESDEFSFGNCNEAMEVDDEFEYVPSPNCSCRQRLVSASSDDSFIVFEDSECRDEELEEEDSDCEDVVVKHQPDPSKKRVHFADDKDLVTVHHMVTWSFAHRAARKGHWEEYARDRMRFQRRIEDTDDRIDIVLQPEYRERIFRTRFAVMDDNQQM